MTEPARSLAYSSVPGVLPFVREATPMAPRPLRLLGEVTATEVYTHVVHRGPAALVGPAAYPIVEL